MSEMLIDFFGRPFNPDEPPAPVPPAPPDPDKWICYGCLFAYLNETPPPITIIEDEGVIFFCSDVCAVSEGFGLVARVRARLEFEGFGFDLICNSKGQMLNEDGSPLDLPRGPQREVPVAEPR